MNSQTGSKKRNKITKYIWLILAIALISVSTITHKYGPYKGQVVNKETGEPIEGAAVFLRFFTEYPSVGGGVSNFADAVETMTDANGEFEISHREWRFRILNYWDPYAPIIIFKPGYGAYPRHPEVTPHFGLASSIPENEYVIIKLPKLKTMEERKDNLRYADFYDKSEVPCEKQRHLLGFINSERKNFGFQPVGDCE